MAVMSSEYSLPASKVQVAMSDGAVIVGGVPLSLGEKPASPVLAFIYDLIKLIGVGASLILVITNILQLL